MENSVECADVVVSDECVLGVSEEESDAENDVCFARVKSLAFSRASTFC